MSRAEPTTETWTWLSWTEPVFFLFCFCFNINTIIGEKILFQDFYFRLWVVFSQLQLIFSMKSNRVKVNNVRKKTFKFNNMRFISHISNIRVYLHMDIHYVLTS